LGKKSLELPIEYFMNREFRYLSVGEGQVAMRKILKQSSLHQIPVLNAEGRIVDLLLFQDNRQQSQISNAVVIMAGGKGTRLLPYTENCPKPMLEVDGKPILEILLEQCISSGFSKFYLSVNYLKEQILDYFQDGRRWGVSIEYLVENKPLGTAGSLQLLPSDLKDPFLVMNGDVLTRFNPKNLLHFHYEHDAAATLCVREHTTTVPFGVVETNGVELIGFVEKPSFQNLVNAGVYVINPKLLPLLPHHQSTDMPTMLINAQKSGYRVVVCPIHEYWIDVGRPETLNEAHTVWENKI